MIKLNIKHLVFLCLIFNFSSCATKRIYILNPNQPEEKTWRAVESHFIKNYESNNLVSTKNLRKNIIECTPKLKKHSINYVASKDLVDYCLEKSLFSINAGIGHLEINNHYNKGTHINLSGQSLALSTSLYISSNLSTLHIFDLNLHLLPNFRNDKIDKLKSIQLSSLISGQYLYQKRIENTPLSSRLGISLNSIPTVKDESLTLDINDIEAKKVNILTVGPSIGVKNTFRYKKGGKQYLKLDYTPIIYADTSFILSHLNSYELKFNYTYNMNRFVSFEFNYSFLEVFLEDNHFFNAKTASLSAKLYPF